MQDSPHILSTRSAINKVERTTYVLRTYNVTGRNEKNNIEIAREILQRLSLPEGMIEFVGDRPGHDFRYSLHCEKTRRLGWRPQVSFEEGLQRTVDWYRANEWWWRPVVSLSASEPLEAEGTALDFGDELTAGISCRLFSMDLRPGLSRSFRPM